MSIIGDIGEGATLGSVIPGVGTVLGGIGGGIFGGLKHLFGGGSKPSTPTASGNPEDPYTATLKQYAGQNAATGQELSGQSQDVLGPTIAYLHNILSSNPAAVQAAARPQVGRVIDQYDTARRTAEEFGPRGGGLTSTLAQSQLKQGEDIASTISQTQNAAEQQAGTLGVQTEGLALTADQLASTNIDDIIRTVLSREQLNVQRRGQNISTIGQIGQAAGSILGLILGHSGGGGGGSTSVPSFNQPNIGQ